MPWTSAEAAAHTKKADTGSKKTLWSKVANENLSKSGDDASAIKIANFVVKRASGKNPSKRSIKR